MKNQNIDNTNYDFLKPLQKRKDMEPDSTFINSVRKKISINQTKIIRRPRNFRVVSVSILAIITLSLLILTLDFFSSSQQTTSIPTPPTALVPEAPTYNYNVDYLISNHSYYKNMHQTLLDGKLVDDQAADIFIVYLEAIKNKDINEIKKYAVPTEPEIEKLIEIYQKIDFNSLYIDTILASQGEPVYEVNLNLKQKDGILSSRKLFIEFYLDKIRINDFLKNL